MEKAGWAAQGRAATANFAEATVTPIEVVRTLSGMEFLEGMRAGRYPPPPIASACDMMLFHVERGVAVFQGTPGFKFYNPLGTVHGG